MTKIYKTKRMESPSINSKKLNAWAKKQHKIVLKTKTGIMVLFASSILANSHVVLASGVEDEKVTVLSLENSRDFIELTEGVYFIDENNCLLDDNGESIARVSEEEVDEDLKDLLSLEESFDSTSSELEDVFIESEISNDKRNYYTIPIYDESFQEFIYETAEKYQVPYKVPFVIADLVSNGTWGNNGLIIGGNYGLTQINGCNLKFIEENYGYTLEEVLNNPYVNMECCIRLLHDGILPNVVSDEKNPNYKDILGTYFGWLQFEQNENACLFAISGVELLETKYKEDFVLKLEERHYYDIPCDHDLQDHIYDTALEYGVPYRLVFTAIDKETAGTWSSNGVVSKTNDYGLSQINGSNLSYIFKNYGYTKEQVLNDPYINVECCIRFMHDEFMPAVKFDETNPESVKALFGYYNGGGLWKSKPRSKNYAESAIQIMNTKFSADFVSVKDSQEEVACDLNAITNKTSENSYEEEKYYTDLYSSIYGLDCEKVFVILSEMTNQFQDSYYVSENRIGSSSLEGRAITCTSKEMAFLLAIRNLYFERGEELQVERTYQSNLSYASQIEYVSNVIGIDKSFTYAVCASTFGFENPMFLVNNNAAGLKRNGEYMAYPSSMAGFIETELEIFKCLIDGFTTTEQIGQNFLYDENWVDSVNRFYTYARENYEELSHFEGDFGAQLILEIK